LLTKGTGSIYNNRLNLLKV